MHGCPHEFGQSFAFAVPWSLADFGRSVTAKVRERPRDAFETADAEFRRLIREGFKQSIPGEQLAEAAGLSLSRVYQIRDGRR